jgi:NADPH:quinone reductase-like Zn-dependent oxidoreductase
MVLGHEATGVVVEVGEQGKNLKPGDRVCMERVSRIRTAAPRASVFTISIRPYVFGSFELRCRLPNNLNKSTVYSGTWKRWNLQSQGFH